MNKLLPILAATALYAATPDAQACTLGVPACPAGDGVTSYDFTKITVNAPSGSVTLEAGAVDVQLTSTGTIKTYKSSGQNLGVGVAGNGSAQVDKGESLTITFSDRVDIQTIVLNNVEDHRKLEYKQGFITVWDADTGEVVSKFAVDDNVKFANAMVLDLHDFGNIISEATLTGGKDSFTLASICYKIVQSPVGVPELSTKGSMSAAFLLAGVGLVLSGRRRQSVTG